MASALSFQFPGSGTAAFFVAALGIFAAYQVGKSTPFFWTAVAFSAVSIGAGVAVEHTDEQREKMQTGRDDFGRPLPEPCQVIEVKSVGNYKTALATPDIDWFIRFRCSSPGCGQVGLATPISKIT